MSELEQRLKDRLAEVDHYLTLLEALEATRTPSPKSLEGRGGRVLKWATNDRTVKILKANLFVLIYNVVEATTRDCIEAVWVKVGNERIGPLGLNPRTRKVWSGARFRRAEAFDASAKVYREILWDLMEDVANGRTGSVDVKKILPAGNLSNTELRRLCEEHGIPFNAPKGSRDGIDLVTVKRCRNDLAHGTRSFEETGAQFALSDLLDIRKRSASYLRQFVRSVARYIASSAYRQHGNPAEERAAIKK